MSEISNSVECLCKYLQRYRAIYCGVNSNHIAGFKRWYNDAHNEILNFLNVKAIQLNNISECLFTLFCKMGSNNIKPTGYILLCDLINNRLKIGKSNLSENHC